MRPYPPGATADPSGRRCRVLAAWREPAGWCCEVLDGWEGESLLHRSWHIGDIDAAAAASRIEASLARRPLAELVWGVQAAPPDEGFVVVQEGRGSFWMRALTRRVSGLSFVVRSNGMPVASGPVGVVRLPAGRHRIFVAWEQHAGLVDDAGWPIELDVVSGSPTHVEVGFPRGLRLAEGDGLDRLDRSWERWRRDGRAVATS